MPITGSLKKILAFRPWFAFFIIIPQFFSKGKKNPRQVSPQIFCYRFFAKTVDKAPGMR
jgi:hypothetical protein